MLDEFNSVREMYDQIGSSAVELVFSVETAILMN